MTKKSDIYVRLNEAAGRFQPTDADVAEALQDLRRRTAQSHHGGELTIASTLPQPTDRRTSGRRWGVTALIAAASFVAGGLAVAQTSSPSEEEIAERYGLQSRPIESGAVGQVTADGTFVIGGAGVSDCSPGEHPGKAIALQEVGDRYYCIVADSEVDAWVIGQRLLGRTPTAEEIAEMSKNFTEG